MDLHWTKKQESFSTNAITEPIVSHSLQNVKQWCSDSLRNSALLTWAVSVQYERNWVVEHVKHVSLLMKSTLFDQKLEVRKEFGPGQENERKY